MLGYGVIDWEEKKCTLLAYGTISTYSNDKFSERLGIIREQIQINLDLYKPGAIAIERPIYCKNVQTALTLGQVCGGITMISVMNNIPIYEITPLEIKQAIVGHGRASKEQVQRMVMRLLGLSDFTGTEHASDALATALCYAHTQNYQKQHKLSYQGNTRKKRGTKWLRSLKEPSSKKPFKK